MTDTQAALEEEIRLYNLANRQHRYPGGNALMEMVLCNEYARQFHENQHYEAGDACAQHHDGVTPGYGFF